MDERMNDARSHHTKNADATVGIVKTPDKRSMKEKSTMETAFALKKTHLFRLIE